MRTHDRHISPLDDPTSDITTDTCTARIDLLVQEIVACGCQGCRCTQNLLEITRWKQRRLDLNIPTQRPGD